MIPAGTPIKVGGHNGVVIRDWDGPCGFARCPNGACVEVLEERWPSPTNYERSLLEVL